MEFLIWYIVYSAYICDIMEERKWFEELPDLCPPSDAMACSGVFYRIAEGDPGEIIGFLLAKKMA